jgi:hypothetical protein
MEERDMVYTKQGKIAEMFTGGTTEKKMDLLYHKISLEDS